MRTGPLRSTEGGGLVGRGTVLAELRSARERAQAGRPVVVSLVGDAGTGKTAVLRAFLRQCDQRTEVSLGSAQEDAGIPYLAVADLLARVGVDPGSAGHGPPEHSEWARWRAVADGIRKRAEQHLVVIGIDDLHWADEASLRLIEHLTTVLADQAVSRPIRALVILAGRSAGSDGRVRRLLGRAGEDPDGRTIKLAGLDATEVATLVHDITGTTLTPTQARDLHHRTGGNPLLVRLLAPTAVEGGPDLDRAEALAPSAMWTRATTGLAPEVRALLDVAAIHGDPIDPAVIGLALPVAAADGAPAAATVADRFERACEAGVLQPDGARWRFTHPELARHLRLALDPSRRERIHAAIADALVAAAGASPPSALALDHHLQRAGPMVDDRRRWAVAAAAGAEALAIGAWARAADAFTPVLPHVDDLPMDDLARTRLLVDAATALTLDSQPGPAIVVLTRAIELAERAGTTDLWGEVLMHAVRNRLSGAPDSGDWPELPGLRIFAEREGDPAKRSRAWVTLADVAFVAGDPAEGLRCCAHARRLAELSGDKDTLAYAEYAAGLQHLGQLEVREARDAFRRCADLAVDSADDVLTSWWKVRLPLTEFLGGDLHRASRHLDLAVEHCRRSARWADQSLADAYRCSVAALQGRFAEAEARADHAVALVRRTGYGASAAVAYPQLACVKALQGDADGALAVAEAMAVETGAAPGWLAPLALAEAGLPAEARAAGPTRPARPLPAVGLASLLGLVARAQLADAAGAAPEPVAAALAARLQEAFERGAVWAWGWTTSVPRALATTALDLGDLDGARQWAGLATDAAARAGAAIEDIQIHLVSAAIERAAGEERASTALTLRALEEAERLGAHGLARRARHALDRPAGPPTGRPTPAIAAGIERVLLFTDIVGSTDLNVVVGDDRFVALLEEHNEIIRRRAERHGGVVFHNTGDGYGVWFTDATDAVACAAEVHGELRAAAHRHPGQTVTIRAGIACGRPTSLDGDLFGVDVVRAARLCAVAEPETIVVDEHVHGRATGRGLRPAERLGPLHLKGFPSPEPAFRIDCTR